MLLEQIGWKSPSATPELMALVDEVRSNEQSIRQDLRRKGESQQDALIRQLIIGDAAEACNAPLRQFQNTAELCEACLQNYGPIDGARKRRFLRERARIQLHLSKNTSLLHTSADLLALWDEATAQEPPIRAFIDEPRWRRESDGLPFTQAMLAPIYGTIPLRPGLETANPADIPQLAEGIVDFARSDELPRELVALGLFYLFFRIHPFVDGNGHTTRMLVSDILHREGYSTPTLLTYFRECVQRAALVRGV